MGAAAQPRRSRLTASVPAALALAAALLACGAEPPAGRGDGQGGHGAEARLYAAASLADVLGALAKEFEPIRGSRVVASYGASSTLAQQVREGAAPGVFLSASAEWADRVVAWGLAEPGTRVDLLTGSLVVVVPKGSKDRPASLEDLADARFARIALGDPAAVPAGMYAKAALEKAGVFESLRPRIVAAPDVRAALVYVERGEAPAGIVYATDAAGSGKVEVAFRVPPDLHPPVVYPMLLVRGAGRRARELYDFLRSDRARAAFEAAGFGVPPAGRGR
jgi:molybdate transport system substrate-binding protein